MLRIGSVTVVGVLTLMTLEPDEMTVEVGPIYVSTRHEGRDDPVDLQ